MTQKPSELQLLRAVPSNKKLIRGVKKNLRGASMEVKNKGEERL